MLILVITTVIAANCSHHVDNYQEETPRMVVQNFYNALVNGEISKAAYYLSEKFALDMIELMGGMDRLYQELQLIAFAFGNSSELPLTYDQLMEMTEKEVVVFLIYVLGKDEFDNFRLEILSEEIDGNQAVVEINNFDEVEINLIKESDKWKIYPDF